MTKRDLLGTVWSCAAAGTGSFACPRCGVERTFDRNTLIRRLTVLGRPVARVGAPSDYLTCTECGHAFDAAVIAETGAEPDGDGGGDGGGDGREVVAEDERALLALLAAVIFSDSVVRRSEKDVARLVIRRYTGGHLGRGGLGDLLRGYRQRWGDPVDGLARLRCLLKEPIRRRIVAAAYQVCKADGELHPQESRLIGRIGEALDLGPRQVRRAIADANRERG